MRVPGYCGAGAQSCRAAKVSQVLDLAGLQAALEPGRALCAAAMREGLGPHRALGLALQCVVANVRGGVQRLFHVATLQDLAGGVGPVGPDAGKTIGLQFHPNRERIHLHLGNLAPPAVHLVGDAHQVLHMVAHLVGDDIGLGEVAGRAQVALQGVVERQVDVDLLVARAVERPHGGLAGAAGRGPTAAEQHQLGPLVGGAVFLEDGRPGVFRVCQHGADMNLASWSSAGGLAAGADCWVGAPPPPLSRLSTVSGLMPKIQPATTAMATVPRPTLRPPMPKPPPAAAATSGRARPRRCHFDGCLASAWVAVLQVVLLQVLGRVTPRWPWYLPPRSL